jgi:antitoxin component of MazEF toxin-antitoxin module
MKFLRRLVRNGHSTQLTLPVALLEHLQWRPGFPVVVELTPAGTLEVRLPTLMDLRAPMDPMEIPSAPASVTR